MGSRQEKIFAVREKFKSCQVEFVDLELLKEKIRCVKTDSDQPFEEFMTSVIAIMQGNPMISSKTKAEFPAQQEFTSSPYLRDMGITLHINTFL
ncbi:hypothetical protein CHS0354_010019 [Potamilus streckersoni]|uniref:Uncharacterized protein n=1 Tax=Potamilus streckersoni TaxID=2493646 RepID=A0AAE0SC79_9BIVA|nr:hypothetical protein CHS0354_010019 [Potamilus streckersoni]